MEFIDGVYRLVSGNGASLCVQVKADVIYALDPGGEVVGTIRVSDRTFVYGRADSPIELRSDGSFYHLGKDYCYTLENSVSLT